MLLFQARNFVDDLVAFVTISRFSSFRDSEWVKLEIPSGWSPTSPAIELNFTPSDSFVPIALELPVSGLVAPAGLLHGTGHLARTAPNGPYRCRPLAQDTEMSS